MIAPDLAQRLQDIADSLFARTDVIAVLGLGSAGAEVHRLDEHSDLDFFVVVDDGATHRYVDDIDWLSAPCPVAYSFANEDNGRKALYADGVFVEYAVFTLDELAALPFAGARVIRQRADAPSSIAAPRTGPPAPAFTVEHQLNEALTNLYVGLHRERRGERLSAARFIQQHAVDRILTILRLQDPQGRWDPFDHTRRVESRFTARQLPLMEMTPGYDANVEAAEAILNWLTARFDTDPAITAAIRGQLDAARQK